MWIVKCKCVNVIGTNVNGEMWEVANVWNVLLAVIPVPNRDTKNDCALNDSHFLVLLFLFAAAGASLECWVDGIEAAVADDEKGDVDDEDDESNVVAIDEDGGEDGDVDEEASASTLITVEETDDFLRCCFIRRRRRARW